MPFVPKTRGEILCRVCAEAEFGPDWAGGREVESSSVHAFTCAGCGADDTVSFRPEPGSALLCRRCYRGEEKPNPERIGGVVIDGGGGVRRFRRRSGGEREE
ncbi:MAG: hypothetical protein EA398_12250 [Deltaproteobacteria bacterium]|nr:MAG: hypothetical protein EA398_12250 [Deltaproteobacteria bacterium]